MKKIMDERLKLRNLENIRIVFCVQTIGILLILAYDLYQGGPDQVVSNPLWIVFILSGVVMNYLHMNISITHEKEIKNPKKPFMISIIVVCALAFALAYFTSITPGFGWSDGLWLSAIVAVCGIIPCYYVYRLKMKQKQELDEEDDDI